MLIELQEFDKLLAQKNQPRERNANSEFGKQSEKAAYPIPHSFPKKGLRNSMALD